MISSSYLDLKLDASTKPVMAFLYFLHRHDYEMAQLVLLQSNAIIAENLSEKCNIFINMLKRLNDIGCKKINVDTGICNQTNETVYIMYCSTNKLYFTLRFETNDLEEIVNIKNCNFFSTSFRYNGYKQIIWMQEVRVETDLNLDEWLDLM